MGVTYQIGVALSYQIGYKDFDSTEMRGFLGELIVHSFTVSPELTALMGSGRVAEAELPARAVALSYDLGGAEMPASLRILGGDDVPAMLAEEDDRTRIILLVDKAVFARMGCALDCDTTLHLTTGLRTIALALHEGDRSAEELRIYRVAKVLELLCETVSAMNRAELIPLAGDGALSRADSMRIHAARRMIDEQAHEKLTLDRIARACGLNRAKLTRGFRETFDCTIAEAIAERRLMLASHRLLTTDLPVSSIGYESGYLNNASFARAFARRFGRSPSDYRAYGIAA